MFLHLFTLCYRGIIEHLRCQTDTGNRRLQLVSHVIDEVVLDFRIPLLSEDDHDGKDECNQKYQRKDDARNHETYTREDIAVHIREMNPYYPHLRLRVVAEEYLRITIFLAFIRIVRTAVNLSSILRGHGEMIRYIDTIVHHLCLEVLIQLLEVDSLLERFV